MENKMKAFHGKQSIKDEYMNRLKDHRERDEIVKGQYWEHGKGCAVGCTVHSNNHKAYEEELGIPMVLARLEDSIFEGLLNEEAKEFPLNFLSAINVGADLSSVGDKFLHWLLVDKIHGVIQYVEDKKIVQSVADLYKKKIDGEYIQLDEWKTVYGDADHAASLGSHASYFSHAARAARAAYRTTRAVATVARVDAADTDTYTYYDAADAAGYHADAAHAHAAHTHAHAVAVAAAAAGNHRAAYKARTAQAAKLIEILKETN